MAMVLLWARLVYTTTATLHIENQAPNITGIPEVFGLEGRSLDHPDQTRLNLLKSRSLAARVIQDLDLGQNGVVKIPSQWKMSHSPGFSGGVCHRSAKASRGEDLEIEEPISCGNCSSFDFHATSASVLGTTLVGHQVV